MSSRNAGLQSRSVKSQSATGLGERSRSAQYGIYLSVPVHGRGSEWPDWPLHPILAKKAAQPLSSVSTSAAAQLEKHHYGGYACPASLPARRRTRLDCRLKRVSPSNLGGVETRVERTTLGPVAAGVHPRREDRRPALRSPTNCWPAPIPSVSSASRARGRRPAADGRRSGGTHGHPVEPIPIQQRASAGGPAAARCPARRAWRRVAVGAFADDHADGRRCWRRCCSRRGSTSG